MSRMPVTTADPASAQWDRSFFGHPRGLSTLFFTEMWERFSFYGMRALLIYYLTATAVHGGLGFTDSKAGAVYGLYTAMVYLMCLGGGWIADLFIGQRRAVLYGGILIAAGEFCLMAPSTSVFYLGLVLLMAGTGFLKGNVSTIVGQLYTREDPRRDSGFSIFYMGINIGALISPIFCGYIGEHYSWRLGFGLCGLGMLAGLVQYVITGRYLGAAGLHPAVTGDIEADRRRKRTAIRALGLGTAVLVSWSRSGRDEGIPLDLNANLISEALGWSLLGISALVFAWLIFFGDWTPEERKRLLLSDSHGALHQLPPCSGPRSNRPDLIAEPLRRAQRRPATSRDSLRPFCGKASSPPVGIQLVEPIFVVGLAPVFAWLWLRMGKREAIQPRQVLGRVVPRRPGVRRDDPRRHDRFGRPHGGPALAQCVLSPPSARRALPEPGRLERHDQTSARAGCGLHDGDLVPFDQHRQLARR